ncbi:hypothetical protein HBH98_205120 [Parastagonospora nodorum]|nr:hypothetical protein HBH53_196820 [Parastagonospora nodorum]KAH3960936.1 hypothetical protein HBH51_186640 [Parastagonospora nodorum]KAH3992736.1 hypothetical protein HBI10_212290 [Parastagonospora nodorum]KAH4029719.1 hypothetical protein HBI13_031600 [Parastagonospora nodorum]KAH4076131.1 hypothetical protein HBH50_000990 [Parastagonospora nodorum]
MSSHNNSSSPSGTSPRTKDISKQTNPTGSTAADIHTFLSQLPPRQHSSLPQSPWTVSKGSYTRTDGSDVYVRGPDDFQANALQSRTNESVKGVYENESVGEGGKNGKR